MSIHFWDKNVKEIRYGQKKVKEVWYGDKKVWPSGPVINTNPNNGLPVGRLHDWELWFVVENKKSVQHRFKIPARWLSTDPYDWSISVDWAQPQQYSSRNQALTEINIPLTPWKHVIKITPTNWVYPWWARAMSNPNYTHGSTNGVWQYNFDEIAFSLEYLPWYAFMESENTVWDGFLKGLFVQAVLTDFPKEFSLPSHIKKVWNDFLMGTFYINRNIKEPKSDNFTIPQHLEEAWNGFLRSAFAQNIYLKKMPKNFRLPANLKKVGNEFLFNTWAAAQQLEKMPDWFNIPQGITEAWILFMQTTRFNCSRLTKMPDGFNIPQSLTKIWTHSFYRTRKDCRSLTEMPNEFSFPQTLTNMGHSLLSETWENCVELKKINDWFKLPQNISNSPVGVLNKTRAGCGKLISIPREFSFPERVFGNRSLANCFIGCVSLSSDAPALPLVIPGNGYSAGYATHMFLDSGIPEQYNTPTPWSSVMVRRNS